jgi:hypothetical protein
LNNRIIFAAKIASLDFRTDPYIFVVVAVGSGVDRIVLCVIALLQEPAFTVVEKSFRFSVHPPVSGRGLAGIPAFIPFYKKAYQDFGEAVAGGGDR